VDGHIDGTATCADSNFLVHGTRRPGNLVVLVLSDNGGVPLSDMEDHVAELGFKTHISCADVLLWPTARGTGVDTTGDRRVVRFSWGEY